MYRRNRALARKCGQFGTQLLHPVFGGWLFQYATDNLTRASTFLQESIWFDDAAVVDGQTDAVFFVRTDHIGRPIFATDDTGTKVWEASYQPFCTVHVSTGAAIDLRFPGQWFHAENGLHQNWMRDYDPTTGRYIQTDPLGLVDGASVYGYVGQNPANWIDPFGTERKKYKKPENPNQKKGAKERGKTGARERNIGHPNAEEHSRRPKGKGRSIPRFSPRFGPPIPIPGWIFTPPCTGPHCINADFEPEQDTGIDAQPDRNYCSPADWYL